MKIVCPYCGSDDFGTYDIQSDDDEVHELKVCYDCNKPFRAIYIFNRIEKEHD